MVIVLDAQAAVTPAGRPVGVPMPVAPVVVIVMLVNAVLIHIVGEEDGVPAVLSGVIVIVTMFDVAGLPDAQVALEVRIHTILSPFVGL